MKTAFIIHGTLGHPEENWFPWLKKELEKIGYIVYVPGFPTPENQTISEWLNTFEKFKDKLDKNSILIGHSRGVAFILNLLEENSVFASFLVSGFVTLAKNEFKEGIRHLSRILNGTR